jgi:hypothetical protein
VTQKSVRFVVAEYLPLLTCCFVLFSEEDVRSVDDRTLSLTSDVTLQVVGFSS